MNIFVTTPFHSTAAQHLDDVRLRKMLIETAQLIATSLRTRFGIDSPYKNTHSTGPHVRWLNEATYNLHWLIAYGLDLHDEHRYRFGKEHASGRVIEEQWGLFTKHVFGEMKIFEEMTPFQNSARNDRFDFTHLPVPESYVAYLNAKWAVDKREPKWTRRGPPAWANFEWKKETT